MSWSVGTDPWEGQVDRETSSLGEKQVGTLRRIKQETPGVNPGGTGKENLPVAQP